MALIINSNISALNSQRQLVRSGQLLDSAMERLSSGKRINSAADDAAGLAISNRMSSQVRGLNQAVRNASDGISLIQTAEGALNESTNILQRIRELSIQSANGIYSNTDRATLDAEVQQLTSELDRIAKSTRFNGRNLLDGSLAEVALQVGAEANQTVSFSIAAMDVKSLGMTGTTSDLIGGEMNINANGLLNNGFESATIKINGQYLGAVAEGSNVQKLLDAINTEIAGVSAAVYTQATAESVGSGMLSGGDSVTLTGIDLDGGQLVISFTNTDSLEQLVEKINTTAGTLYNARIDDGGRLSVGSETMVSISIADDTGGIASGMSVSTIADADIAATITGLTERWVAQSEKLIEDYFGVTGTHIDLTLNLDDSDGVSNNLASVSFLIGGAIGDTGTAMKLNIDMADFTADNQPDGGNAPYYNDRIIAHEMVHAVLASNFNTSLMPGWFTEGIAELIHGADERVEGDFANIDELAELTAAFKTTPGSPTGATASSGYSAGYLATKMLQDDLVAVGSDIAELFVELKGGGIPISLDQAVQNLKTNHAALVWTDLASFEAHFLTNGVDYLNETYVNGQLDLFDGSVDTGSISGSDYGGGAKTATTVMPDTAIGIGDGSPNFNFIIPDQYNGLAFVAEAQLILTSDSDQSITVTRGLRGEDSDLSDLGFRTISESGLVLGEGLNSADQNAVLSSTDLRINGVKIAAVNAGLGLFSKIDGINAVTNETGVIAAIEASASYSHSQITVAASEVSSNSAIAIGVGDDGVLAINGIGIAVSVGDTASNIAASVNVASAYHSVTAYADEEGELHLYAARPITLGVSTVALGTALGAIGAEAAGTGSIKIGGTEVSLSDLSDIQVVINDINAEQAATGVRASIDGNGELALVANSGFSLALGQTNGLKAFATLGISFSAIDDTADLTDSNSDNRLADESVAIEPRILLRSINDQTISVDVTAAGAQATGLSRLNETLFGSSSSSLATLSVLSSSQAQAAIGVVDNALETINSTRSDLGAISNRLDFTVSNLMNISENTAAARSRIVDADFAAETAKLSRTQVLQQAAQAMLAQANSAPQQVLSLLR